LNVSVFNPEIVRNTRIQLRRGRMLATAVICLAISLSSAAYFLYSHIGHPPFATNPLGLFQLTVTLQVVALLIGGGIYCLQSVHREKDLNTFDYQRITRMSPLELSVGKLLGVPALPYFAVVCLMPIAGWAAILAHVPVSAFLQIYVLLVLGSITYHALALLVSLLLERGTSAGGILFFLAVVGMSSIDFSQGGRRLRPMS
jgi:ABC-type Na+ efflux pump permease subunit